MDDWDQCLWETEVDGRAESLLNPFVFFFKLGKDYFAGDENSRVIFAKMKNPDEDLPSGWQDEADFSGHNLSKLVRGEPAQHLFNFGDLKKVKVIDKEKAKEIVKKFADKEGPNAFPQQRRTISFINLAKLLSKGSDSDQAPNFSRADEE